MEPTDIPNRLLGELRLSSESVDNRANMESSLVFSPDEFFLHQRGRRKISVWSPQDSANTPVNSPFQRTPTKILSSSMILRSSPRKRLTMGSTPEFMDDRLCSPKTAINARTQLWSDTPTIAKKPRLSDMECTSIACQNKDTPLSAILKGYSQSQLIELILEEIGDNKSKEQQFRNRLPIPSLDTLENELQHAKRNIYKSLPTSRLCKKTDSAAYSRAALHLNEFKRLLSHHTKELHESSHSDALLDYVIMSWPYVRATPIWENVTHNAIRRQCFKLLTSQCISAIKSVGLRLGSVRLRKLEKNLQDWAKDYEDVLLCISTLNKTLTRGRTSL